MKYIKKPIKQDESLLLVDIDDNSMNSEFIPFSWPWPRYIHGDALEVLADFGAKAVVYDIEFLGKSSAGVNIDKVNEVKISMQNDFQSILENYENSTTALSKNSNMRNDLQPLWNNFSQILTTHYENISNNFNKSIEDNDEYFAKRIRYFGKAFGTVNMLTDPQLDPKDIKKEDKENNLKNLKNFGYPIKDLLKNKKSHPAIVNENVADFPNEKILNNYSGVGFTRVERDKDAAIRSINLFMEKDGYVIPQLSLVPLLKIYNIKPEQIDFSSNNSVVLKDVEINGEKTNINIPVNDKKMLINWPGKFDEMFISNKKELKTHFSYQMLLNYKYNALKNLESSLNYFSDYKESEKEYMLYKEYQDFKNRKNELVENNFLDDKLREDMNNYFDDYLNRLNLFTGDEEYIKNIENLIDKEISTGNFQQYSKDEWLQIKNAIRNNMKKVNDDTKKVIEIRSNFKDELKDKICFIGWTGTGTTDIGSMPFEKKFVNVGTHPSVFNTIIQKDFIFKVSVWIVLIISIVFFGIIVWFLTRKKSTIIAGIGFSSVILIVILDTIFYRMTNFYITPVIPFLYGFFCIITMIILEFIITESDKSFLRNTFSRYLSPDVIHELLKDPDKVELGGERRNCTAIFTDIEGFSSFSELFMDDPKGLVSLLNGYLSTMSDIILNNGGTIDKYEGDAIIGFFGAPHDMIDHPLKACISSIKMKQAELILNKSLMDQKLIEKPLHTRIGINTGEMFVGNMGTEKRMDYTMMGHAVNLAARLEGVNKQYGTYQLISEFTYEKISDKITTRKLDRVRVVNIKTPIRLYELIALKEETTKDVIEYLDLFHGGLEEFENKKWKEALKLFKMVKDLREIDVTTDIYIDRCKKFIKNPPVDENWDGVYTLTVK